MAVPPRPRGAIVAYLAADADVAALAGTRIYGAELPGEEAANMPRYAVVVQSAGGLGDRSYSPQYNARFDVFAYGATPAEAEELQYACIQALKRLEREVINSTILYSATREAGPNPGRTQTSYWPFSFSVWSVETSYTEVI